MSHYLIDPAPPLGEFVSALWLWEEYAPGHARERVLPTGAAALVVDLDTGELVVSGPRSEYMVLETARPRSLLGAQFRPGGAYPFLGGAAAALHNQTAPLAAVWGSAAEEVQDRVLAAGSPAAKLGALEAALRSRLARAPERDPAVAYGLARFEDPAGPPTVGEVTAALGLRARQFIARFREEVGLTPKRYCRVRRFQEALRRVERGRPVAWAELALDCGYFDQAHFVHDFRAFAGFSPGAYLARRGEWSNHVPHEG